MRIDHIAEIAIADVLGALIRRAIVALAVGCCSIVAIYHISVAGLLALGLEYGPLQARLVIAAIYAGIALIVFVAFRTTTRRKLGAVATTTMPLDSSREMRIAALVEALMLGYTLARKRERAR
jgi:hypothetical protein